MQDLQVSPDELFRRLKSSDRKAFSDLFEAFHEPLLRYARRFAHDDGEACDILQDVFMRLWEQRSSLFIASSGQALLYTMVRNRALNIKRREKWFDRSRNAEDIERPDTSSTTADEEVHTRSLLERVHSWIREMPERRAEAFMLSRYHGLSHKEIAAIMGVSERTVDTHILLALRELRARLDKLDT